MAYYKKNYNSDGPSAEDKALDRFVELMVERIRTIQADWKKPWFTESALKWPKNLSGREYNGMNALMLTFQAEKKGYKLPVWCTFDRVVGLNFNKDKEGKRSPVTDKNGVELPHVSVNKGERSFPVFITTFTCIDKETKERIKYDDYKLLSNEEKQKINVYPKLNVYNVFNVSQTNLQEARPELYAKLEEQNKLTRPELRGEENSFEPLDKMIKDQSWICPINLVHQDNAFYSISKNAITLPEKSQFIDAESFAGTAFHECIHSTGSESQLNRLKPEGGFGSSEYAREELVAELGSALVAQRYGLVKHVKEDSVAYLKSWLDSLKESPDFIKTTLVDVKKASSILTLKLDAIAEELAQQKNEQQDESNKNAVTPTKEPVYYASVQYLQLASDTEPFDKLTPEQMLQEARNYDDGDAINLDFTHKSPELHQGDTIAAEDEHYAVVYNGTVGGTYNILRKVSEQEVRDNITRYGIDRDTSADVRAVACNMVADKFEKMTRDRMPVIEMPNGNLLYIQYDKEKDTLDVGSVTNTGFNVMQSFPYDHDFSLDSNLEGVNEKLTEMLVYQAEIETEPDYYVAEQPHSLNNDKPATNREALDNFMTDIYWAARRDNGFRMDGFENYQGKECLKLDNSDVQGSSYYLVSRQPADATKGETHDKFFMHLYDPDTQQEVFSSREMPNDRESAYSFMRGGFRELEDYESSKQQDNQENVEEEHHFRRGR